MYNFRSLILLSYGEEEDMIYSSGGGEEGRRGGFETFVGITNFNAMRPKFIRLFMIIS